MDHSQFLEAIKAHPYATIVTVSILEGKLTSVMAAAFAAKGHLNIFIAYAIFCIMTIVGNIVFYYLGYSGRKTGKILRKSWIESLSVFHGKLERRLPFALVTVSFIGKGAKPVIFLAGVSKMPFPKFLTIICVCTPISYGVYMSIGYFFALSILS